MAKKNDENKKKLSKWVGNEKSRIKKHPIDKTAEEKRKPPTGLPEGLDSLLSVLQDKMEETTSEFADHDHDEHLQSLQSGFEKWNKFNFEKGMIVYQVEDWRTLTYPKPRQPAIILEILDGYTHIEPSEDDASGHRYNALIGFYVGDRTLRTSFVDLARFSLDAND